MIALRRPTLALAAAIAAAAPPAAGAVRRDVAGIAVLKMQSDRLVAPSRAPECRLGAPQRCSCDGPICRLVGSVALLVGGMDAEPCFARAVDADPHDMISRFRLGQMYDSCGRRGEAIRAFASALRSEYPRIYSAREAYAHGNCPQAIDQARMAVEIAPASHDAHFQQALMLASCEPRDLAGAIAGYRRAAALGYADPYIWSLLAHAQSMAGDHDAAVATLRAHGQHTLLGDAVIAEASMARGRFREAADAYAAVVGHQPGNPWFRTRLGAALWGVGDREGARREWQAALATNPGFAPAALALQQHR